MFVFLYSEPNGVRGAVNCAADLGPVLEYQSGKNVYVACAYVCEHMVMHMCLAVSVFCVYLCVPE